MTFQAIRRFSHSSVPAAVLLALLSPAQADPRPPDGFWKCKEQSDIKGEFAGEDPIGLAAGKHIKTNCAIHKNFDGKIYCFASLPSLEFLASNRELLAKAITFWDALRNRTPTN